MNANNILIDDVRLDVILRHYDNLGILVKHAIATKDIGGTQTIQKWDKKRTDKSHLYDVEITIEEVSNPLTFK